MILLDYRHNFARGLVSFFRNSRLDGRRERTLFVALVATSIVLLHIQTHTRNAYIYISPLPFSTSIFLCSLYLPLCLSLFIRFLVRHNYIFGSRTDTRTRVHTVSLSPLAPRSPAILSLVPFVFSLSFFLFLYRES